MFGNDLTSEGTSEPASTSAVDRFLAAIRNGSFATAAALFADDVRLDATVPGWRFQIVGDRAVRDEYCRWFGVPADLAELARHRTAAGEVVEYFMTWCEGAVVHGAHHVHLLTLDRGQDRISEDHVFCGGRWPASLLAEMNAPTFAAKG